MSLEGVNQWRRERDPKIERNIEIHSDFVKWMLHKSSISSTHHDVLSSLKGDASDSASVRALRDLQPSPTVSQIHNHHLQYV